MRVYLKGEVIPIRDVTWEILGNPYTKVVWDEDVHIPVWPDHIIEARNRAIEYLADFSASSGLLKRFSSYIQRLIGEVHA